MVAVEFRSNVTYHTLGLVNFWKLRANNGAIVIEECHVVLQDSNKGLVFSDLLKFVSQIHFLIKNSFDCQFDVVEKFIYFQNSI